MWGCCDNPTSSNGFISPFDGQTDWSPVAPLLVHLPDPIGPDGQAVPQELLGVLDLEAGGLIAGEIAADGNDLWFFPDEPFPAGHRFAWTVAAPFDQARQVHLALPTKLQGTSTFHTGARTEPLAAAYQNGELCILLSRAADDAGVRAWADGVPLDLGTPTELGIDTIGLETGPASQQCAAADSRPGGIRVERGPDVWQLPVQTGTVESALRMRHRNMKAEASP
jgi:hypothetical protein